ncbi:DHA2 family lincomycin resistance protein-like MFS transporter [Microcella alkaliphila]|uniref:DHA2 family lincomycin resistance protein-like MFS transporter n=1 Tax=Microcella alkaliphila TaxID=279828 RepID=A0A4Q7TCN3_9MICO|nr:DHA2 family efflux MFS transporter permease subunit [Microcella alkaliphila]RZT58144.1 DHA2 family lincomycin resistance protein-like MFS transporter [Microcella alkaliphila]
MTTTNSPAPPASAPVTAAQRRIVLGVLIGSAFVVILNETLMGVAIPRFIQVFGITATTAQWLTTAFMLTLAVVIPITGWLLQRFSTRALFVTAMSLFTSGTLLGALAPFFELLIVARVIQASGTAIVMPMLFTTVFALVAPGRRGQVIGTVSTVIAVAPAVGPSLSGFILSIADWHWLFITMLPLTTTALVVGALRMVDVSQRRGSRLDLVSIMLSVPGFGGLVFGLAQLGEGGHADGGSGSESVVVGTISLGVGVVALTVFVLRQLRLQRTDDALLDMRTFAERQFALSIGIITVASMSLFGAIIIIPLYVQEVLGASPLVSGLVILPGALLQGLMAPLIGRRYDKVGPRSLVIPGIVLMASTLWGMSMFTSATPIWLVAVANIGIGLGLALLFTPLLTNGLAALRPQLNPYGSAIVGTVQQVAGAAGIALFLSVAAFVAPATGEASISADGVRAAFTVAAALATAVIPLVLLVRWQRGTGGPEGTTETGSTRVVESA